MRIIDLDTRAGQREAERLVHRSVDLAAVEPAVRRIVEAVRRRGDAAVASFTQRFDGVRLAPTRFRVSAREVRSAAEHVERGFAAAMARAARSIRRYHARQRPRSWSMSARGGRRVGERIVPLRRVGVYIPGGVAPLVSTVLMTVIPAQVAGVREIALVTPPQKDGRVNPYLLFVADRLGVGEIYRIGGAQAIAALAFGTRRIASVDKIVGPGNLYVTAAKRVVLGQVAIDALHGPSEVLVVADETADALEVALDLLAQAEHGTGEEYAVLVTTSRRLAGRVAILAETAAGARRAIARSVRVVVAASRKTAVDFANRFAPEHLHVMTKDARAVAKRITTAGAVFIGRYSPVPLGDFVAGPSHVLPTGGTAVAASGLSVQDFVRRMSVIEYTKHALQKAAPDVRRFAAVEGLLFHALAVERRVRAGPLARLLERVTKER